MNWRRRMETDVTRHKRYGSRYDRSDRTAGCRCFTRPGLWLSLLFGVLAMVGCGMRTPEIPPEVVAFSDNMDEYLAEYEARYQLRPRPAESPQAVAEAYLREYQPGPLPRIFETTVIYDRNGNRLAELYDDGRRTWVPLDAISPHLIRAVIATEDSTFYENPGYDPRRVVGAMMQNAEAGEIVSGASTLTMQLARQLFFTPQDRFEQSMDRKAFEALLAQELTQIYSKDEILEMYLNLVHFGRRAYGIEAAANLYFDKSAADLTAAEATFLAGLPQQPGEYDPYTNFEAVRQRQLVVLSLLVRHGYMSQVEANFIRVTEIQLADPNEPAPQRAPHFVNFVIDRLQEALPDQDIDRSGLQVRTSLDLRMQELAQQTVTEKVAELRPTYDLSNGALMALRPGTAEILAMVGSADFDDEEIDGQVNVATSSRQPGSAIKPVLYALAMHDLQISPATVIWDVPATYRISENNTYRPRNYDEDFHGPVTARTALANSYNIPAVKLLDAVGVPRMLEGAHAMGLHSLDRGPDWYGLSLTLGGGEVTLLDLSTAFHTLANGGAYQTPQAILAIEDAPAELASAFDELFSQEETQVIAPPSAFLVTDILSDNEARATEFGENSMLRLDRPAAAKTGTTTDYRDNWTLGYTRYLVAGVWAGNSDGRPMRNASGVTGAAPIWNAFMQAVLEDPELLDLLDASEDPADWEFEAPEEVVEAPIACPSGIDCPEGELFEESWLARMDETGPLADSVAINTMNSVYVDRGRGRGPVGACSAESGSSRQLLRLPMGLTRTLPPAPELLAAEPGGGMVALDRRPSVQPRTPDPDLERKIRDEQEAALAWSASNNSPLYLGPCEEVETLMGELFGDSLVSVDIREFGTQVASVPVEDEDTEEDAGTSSAANESQSQSGSPSSTYRALGVAHDANCGGNQVMGSVTNSQGAPLAGVRLRYTDNLGNLQERTTSGSDQGYGSFAFPVLAPEQAHTINITVLAADGTPAGGAAEVPHLQGGPTDAGCHYVIWQGVD